MLWGRSSEKGERERLRATARKQLESMGYDALFGEQQGDAIPPNFADLWLLHSAVMADKPSLVLEYGSGYSTYVLGKTLKSIGSGKVISIELDADWRSICEARLTPDLAPYVEFRSPTPAIRMVKSLLPGGNPEWFNKRSKEPRRIGIATITFPELYDLKPDFIFLDGPDPSQVPGYLDSLTDEPLPPIVSDPLVFEKHKPSTICVDGRREQCAFLHANLSGQYDLKIHQVQRFTFFRPQERSLL